tara:strand:- start:40976 stop:42274 length:1299 start_codon:yes stop_codon:yes gene_type:complete
MTMSKVRIYVGGEIASEDSPKLERADVLVEDGKIKAVAPNLKIPEGAITIDCAGKVILPSFYDVHVHAREPGQEGKETIATCADAAINGGVTGVVLMPNTAPSIDSGDLVRAVLEKGKATPIEVETSGCITKQRAGEELAGISGMKSAGVALLTDDGSPIENPQVLRRAMEYAKTFDLFLASHCETMALTAGGAMNEGAVSYRLGLPGIPAISEEVTLDRDIRIAQYTGTHVHIQHVTTARGLNTIRRFKEEMGAQGFRVSCEVSPHHLIFNEEDIQDYDTHYKMNPPLRTPEDNLGLLQGLIEGVIDVIATDHAPHTEFEKNTDFESAPFGITGLETAVPSLYHHFIKPGKFGWDLLVKRYSAEPRRLMKKEPVKIAEGQSADLVVFDPNTSTHFTNEFMKSKSSNTPFLDQQLDGAITEVLLKGKVLLSR